MLLMSAFLALSWLEMTCQPDGMWNGSAPVCEAILGEYPSRCGHIHQVLSESY